MAPPRLTSPVGRRSPLFKPGTHRHDCGMTGLPPPDPPLQDAQAPDHPDLSRDLRPALGGVRVLARRLSLLTPGVAATVPMVRGVWGAVLHDRDPAACAAVFEGRPAPSTPTAPAPAGRIERRPLYMLRPAPPDSNDNPALEWISLGAALDRDSSLLEAWMEVTARGLGPNRVPMAIRRVRTLGPDGALTASGFGGAFRLDAVPWPLPGEPGCTPCRLRVDVPMRLVRKGRLLTTPTLADVVVAGLRRLAGLAEDEAARTRLGALLGPALVAARETPALPWQGEPAHLHRYSANQGEMDLQGVVGALDLPEGLGALWPLLVALTWVHVGKGTVFGLGQVHLETPT